jgi:hypothetical protein
LAVIPWAAAQDPFQPYLGFYVPADGAAAPAAMPEFANFLIAEAGPGIVRGRVVPNKGQVRDFLRAKIQNGDLTFETKRVNGVSYSFAGQFLKSPPAPADGKTAVLEGTLKRFRNGAAAGSVKLRFALSPGGGE